MEGFWGFTPLHMRPVPPLRLCPYFNQLVPEIFQPVSLRENVFRFIRIYFDQHKISQRNHTKVRSIWKLAAVQTDAGLLARVMHFPTKRLKTIHHMKHLYKGPTSAEIIVMSFCKVCFNDTLLNVIDKPPNASLHTIKVVSYMNLWSEFYSSCGSVKNKFIIKSMLLLICPSCKSHPTKTFLIKSDNNNSNNNNNNNNNKQKKHTASDILEVVSSSTFTGK